MFSGFLADPSLTDIHIHTSDQEGNAGSIYCSTLHDENIHIYIYIYIYIYTLQKFNLSTLVQKGQIRSGLNIANYVFLFLT